MKIYCIETIEEHRDKNGALHNMNGPALIDSCGNVVWSIHGIPVDFKR